MPVPALMRRGWFLILMMLNKTPTIKIEEAVHKHIYSYLAKSIQSNTHLIAIELWIPIVSQIRVSILNPAKNNLSLKDNP